jgi:thioester reductase-like protein
VEFRVRALVAGLTGQLGAGLIEATEGQDVAFVPVARPVRGRSARDRIARLYPERPEVSEAAVEGDIGRPLWGLSDEAIDGLAGEVDTVINVAAETNWAATDRQLRRANVMGATHGLDLAARLTERGGKPVPYCWASSVHVAGGRHGRIPEQPLGPDPSRTPYELSKWLAERALLEHAAGNGVTVGVARVGGLVGNSHTGRTAKRNSLYMLADRLRGLPLRVMPIVPMGRLDMLPRDRAAGTLLAFARVLSDREPGSRHLVHVSAGDSAPTTAAVIGALRYADWRGEAPRPRTVRVPPSWVLNASGHLDRVESLSARWSNAVTGLRYLAIDRIFERDRLAGLVDGPLPSTSADELVRLAFELREPLPRPFAADNSLARFAG